MASITLDRMWVNLLATGASVSGFSRDRASSFSTAVEVRQYAGGRQRAVSSVGEAGTFSFTLVDVPAATVDTLRLWAGQAVQVRDDRGRLFVGVYAGVTPTDQPYRPDLYAVAVTVQAVTADVGV